MVNKMPETFIEVRCPACVKLGWYSARLLFRVYGNPVTSDTAKLQIVCHRCKSMISWTIGQPELEIIKHGQKNERRQVAAFE